MGIVAGASRYLNAATLAVSKGQSPVTASLLDSNGLSILDAGRRSVRGIGVSASSRALTENFLNGYSSDYNKLLTLGVGNSLSIQGLQTQIKALRASLPSSSISSNAFGLQAADDGSAAASNVGTTVDQEA